MMSLGRYRVNQYNLESALMYKGFSWQSEWHHKNIIDRKNGDSTTQLQGYYIQAGYFFHSLIDKFPKKLEIAAWHARYRPDTQLNENQQYETSIAFNWFFSGHKNKLTSEISHFGFQDKNLPLSAGWRFRLQWDISL